MCDSCPSFYLEKTPECFLDSAVLNFFPLRNPGRYKGSLKGSWSPLFQIPIPAFFFFWIGIGGREITGYLLSWIFFPPGRSEAVLNVRPFERKGLLYFVSNPSESKLLDFS